jgi:hypothetical protein
MPDNSPSPSASSLPAPPRGRGGGRRRVRPWRVGRPVAPPPSPPVPVWPCPAARFYILMMFHYSALCVPSKHADWPGTLAEPQPCRTLLPHFPPPLPYGAPTARARAAHRGGARLHAALRCRKQAFARNRRAHALHQARLAPAARQPRSGGFERNESKRPPNSAEADTRTRWTPDAAAAGFHPAWHTCAAEGHFASVRQARQPANGRRGLIYHMCLFIDVPQQPNFCQGSRHPKPRARPPRPACAPLLLHPGRGSGCALAAGGKCDWLHWLVRMKRHSRRPSGGVGTPLGAACGRARGAYGRPFDTPLGSG